MGTASAMVGKDLTEPWRQFHTPYSGIGLGLPVLGLAGREVDAPPPQIDQLFYPQASQNQDGEHRRRAVVVFAPASSSLSAANRAAADSATGELRLPNGPLPPSAGLRSMWPYSIA